MTIGKRLSFTAKQKANFCHKVYTLRTKMGLTQQEFAELLGFKNRETICRLENDKGDVTDRVMLQVKNLEREYARKLL